MSDRGLDDPEYLQREVERLTAECDDAVSTLKAWFEVKSMAREQMEAEFVSCVQGYLRRSRSGGMSKKESDLVESVLEDFARLYLVDTFWPILLRIAEEKRGDLKVPAGLAPQNGMTDQKIFDAITKCLDNTPKMPTAASDLDDHERKFFNIITHQSGMLLFLQNVFSDRLRYA